MGIVNYMRKKFGINETIFKKRILLAVLSIIIVSILGYLYFSTVRDESDNSLKEDSMEFYKISSSDGLYVNDTRGDFDGDGKEEYAVVYLNPTTSQIKHVAPQSAFIAIFNEGGKLLGSIKDININYGMTIGTITPIFLSDSDKKQYLTFIFGQGAHGYGLKIYSFQKGKFIELECQFKDETSPCAFGGDGGYPPIYQVIGDFDKDGNVEVLDWYRDWPYYQKYEKVRYSIEKVWRWDEDKFVTVPEDEYREIKKKIEVIEYW